MGNRRSQGRTERRSALGFYGSLLLWGWLACEPAVAAQPASIGQALSQTPQNDAPLARYFEREVRLLEANTVERLSVSRDEWNLAAPELREQLFEMLSLSPRPARTPLSPVVAKTFEQDGVVVECLHFQSLPGLYVTGNFYRPKEATDPLPTVLYVCGHAQVKDPATAAMLGNKTAYHHHGAWFARNGYACLTIDSVQLGEIEGIHHGTYKYGMWWWNSRGYSSAGVEAWNCIRALDYLESRTEVDRTRIGVTGRSGGGAYSWWIAALDERIRVAAPVAGITSLRNHVVDNCVEGHCDCMFPVNTYRWDFPLVAALVAPRPLLIVNTDRDPIFPVDGVFDVYQKTRRVYRTLGAEDRIALQISEGGHNDTQELQVAVFHWFNRHLKGSREQKQIRDVAEPMFARPALKVFESLPTSINANVHASFVPVAQWNPGPEAESAERLEAAYRQVQEKCFRGWPAAEWKPIMEVTARDARDGYSIERLSFSSQDDVPLEVWTVSRVRPPGEKLPLHLRVIDDAESNELLKSLAWPLPESDRPKTIEPSETGWNHIKSQVDAAAGRIAYVAPRGIGRSRWTGDDRKQTHLRRRFMLLGQTADAMRVFDVVQAAAGLREIYGMSGDALDRISGADGAAVWAMYAALQVPQVKRLDLTGLPASHQTGPDFLNVLRVWDVPQATSLVKRRIPQVQLSAAP